MSTLQNILGQFSQKRQEANQRRAAMQGVIDAPLPLATAPGMQNVQAAQQRASLDEALAGLMFSDPTVEGPQAEMPTPWTPKQGLKKHGSDLNRALQDFASLFSRTPEPAMPPVLDEVPTQIPQEVAAATQEPQLPRALEILLTDDAVGPPSELANTLGEMSPEERPGFMQRLGQALEDNKDFISDFGIALAQGLDFNQAVAYSATRQEERAGEQAAAEQAGREWELEVQKAEVAMQKDLAATGKLEAETQKLLSDMAKGDDFNPETYARLYADAVKHINSNEFLEDPNNPPFLATEDQARYWINNAVPEEFRQYNPYSEHHVEALVSRLNDADWKTSEQTKLLSQFEVTFGRQAANTVAQRLLQMSQEE